MRVNPSSSNTAETAAFNNVTASMNEREISMVPARDTHSSGEGGGGGS